MGTITPDMVKRRLIYDCMADPTKVSALAGLVGVSEEGDEAEEEASLARLGAIAAIFPQLSVIAEWMAETATLLNLATVPQEQIPVEFMEHMNTMFFTVIQGSLVAAMSVLNDLGHISIDIRE